MKYPNELGKRKEAREAQDKAQGVRNKMVEAEKVLGFIHHDAFQDYLDDRLIEDQKLIAASSGESLFEVGKAVGRVEMILEIRAAAADKKKRLQSAAAQYQGLQKQATRKAP